MYINGVKILPASAENIRMSANLFFASEYVLLELSTTLYSIPLVNNADRSIVFYLFFVNTEPHSTYWPMPTLISEQISCLALSKISVIRFWNLAEKKNLGHELTNSYLINS